MCRCRVVTLSNGLRALLISDQNSSDINSVQNGKQPAVSAETTVTADVQKLCPAQDDDAGVIESDDEDNNWTDVSSDCEMSDSSVQDDHSAADSDCSNKRAGGKKRPHYQRGHSASNVHGCNSAEKLVTVC